MSNTPLAYNPSPNPLISGTDQVGDLAAGASEQDYGVVGQNSNVTFWNSPNDTTGYLIGNTGLHSGHTSTGLTPANVGFFRSTSKTEESFIDLAQYISRQENDPQVFTSGGEASSWLTNNGFWNSYSDVVTSGLTLRLDASNNSSYPGSGNIWYDLVYPQENITLVNSPTYSSSSPSYFTFNGTNQKGTGTGQVLSLSSYTKSVWFYLTSYSDNNLVSSESGGHFMYMAGSNKIYCGHSDWPAYNLFPSNTTFDLNTWYYVALTFNTTDGMKLYVNGVLDSTYTAIKTPLPGDGSTNIAVFGGGNFLNGRIARVFCYDRSLTAGEVLSNYNGTEVPFVDPTPTPTSSLTPTPTPSLTPTQTNTPTVTITPTNTQTPTVTQTPTNTNTPTPSITASQTITPTPSVTKTQTPTPSVTTSNTPTLTPTNTNTPTPTSPVITSGLQLWLDAGNSASYPGSGTTWYDLSPNQVNATLQSGVGYSSLDGGSLTFDGVNDYVDTNQSLASSQFTISAWVKCTNASAYRMIVSKETNAGSPWNYRMYLGITNGYLIGDISSGGEITKSTNYANGTWVNTVFVRDTVNDNLYLYVNGVLAQTTTDLSTGVITNAQNVWIGKSAYLGGNYPFLGNISIVMIYNKVLNAAEILQNFNAVKSRYGL